MRWVFLPSFRHLRMHGKPSSAWPRITLHFRESATRLQWKQPTAAGSPQHLLLDAYIFKFEIYSILQTIVNDLRKKPPNSCVQIGPVSTRTSFWSTDSGPRRRRLTVSAVRQPRGEGRHVSKRSRAIARLGNLGCHCFPSSYWSVS